MPEHGEREWGPVLVELTVHETKQTCIFYNGGAVRLVGRVAEEKYLIDVLSMEIVGPGTSKTYSAQD